MILNATNDLININIASKYLIQEVCMSHLLSNLHNEPPTQHLHMDFFKISNWTDQNLTSGIYPKLKIYSLD